MLLVGKPDAGSFNQYNGGGRCEVRMLDASYRLTEGLPR